MTGHYNKVNLDDMQLVGAPVYKLSMIAEAYATKGTNTHTHIPSQPARNSPPPPKKNKLPLAVSVSAFSKITEVDEDLSENNLKNNMKWRLSAGLA